MSNSDTTTERDVVADVIAALDMYTGTMGSEETTIEELNELDPTGITSSKHGTIALVLSNGDVYHLRVRAA